MAQVKAMRNIYIKKTGCVLRRQGQYAWFGFSEYGGKRAAINAAKDLRSKWERRYPDKRYKNSRGLIRWRQADSRSETKISGVNWSYGLRGGVYWDNAIRAVWGPLNEQECRSLSVAKYGLRQAFFIAVREREDAIGHRYPRRFIEERFEAFRRYYLKNAHPDDRHLGYKRNL